MASFDQLKPAEDDTGNTLGSFTWYQGRQKLFMQAWSHGIQCLWFICNEYPFQVLLEMITHRILTHTNSLCTNVVHSQQQIMLTDQQAQTYCNVG